MSVVASRALVFLDADFSQQLRHQPRDQCVTNGAQKWRQFRVGGQQCDVHNERLDSVNCNCGDDF